MAMTRYYTLDENGELEELHLPVEINGEAKLHPSAEEAASLSAYTMVIESEPEHSAGVIIQQDGWELRDNEWHQKWKTVPVPTPEPEPQPEPEPDPTQKTRVFSKLKMVSILMQMDLWDTVKDWIERMGLYDLYLAAQVFADDNEHFSSGLQNLKTQLELSDDQIEQILQASEIEV